MFFAGSEGQAYHDVLKRAGIENRLESFWAIGFGKQAPAQNQFKNYLLDSGGYSARIRGIEIDVKDYANYLNKHQIKVAFNLDTNDVKETLLNQDYLEKSTDTYIIPIYHLSDWLSDEHRWLIEKYVAEYPYISYGGSAGGKVSSLDRKKFLNYAFSHSRDKVRVHGLGMTAEWMITSYPYYSVDSTSWISIARFANSKVYSPEMAKVVSKKQHYLRNVERELEYWILLQQKVSKLWASRGVSWEDFNPEEYKNGKS